MPLTSELRVGYLSDDVNVNLAAISAALFGTGIGGTYTPFHGEVVSADANAGVAFALYKAGVVAAYTLLGTEYVLITDVILGVTTSGGPVVVCADADTAGLRVFTHPIPPALGGWTEHLFPGHLCPVGVVPKLIAPAACGAVRSIIHGFIITPA